MSVTFAELAALRVEIANLLREWPLEKVEEEAWVFALDGWQRPPPLLAAYDALFARFVRGIEEVVPHPTKSASLELAHFGMEELRNRAQFIQVRASDIRLNHQLPQLLGASSERVEAVLARALENEQMAVELLTQHKGIVEAYMNALARSNGEAPASLIEKATKLAPLAVQIARYAPEIAQWLERLIH